jgi:hypothetical protein
MKSRILIALVVLALLAVLAVGLPILGEYRAWQEDLKRQRALAEQMSHPLVATNGPTVCSLHSLVLVPGLVPLRREIRRKLKGRDEYFPCANEYYQGHFCGLIPQPTNALVLYCPKCRDTLADRRARGLTRRRITEQSAGAVTQESAQSAAP